MDGQITGLLIAAPRSVGVTDSIIDDRKHANVATCTPQSQGRRVTHFSVRPVAPDPQPNTQFRMCSVHGKPRSGHGKPPASVLRLKRYDAGVKRLITHSNAEYQRRQAGRIGVAAIVRHAQFTSLGQTKRRRRRLRRARWGNVGQRGHRVKNHPLRWLAQRPASSHCTPGINLSATVVKPDL